jgi:hypothetical protein
MPRKFAEMSRHQIALFGLGGPECGRKWTTITAADTCLLGTFVVCSGRKWESKESCAEPQANLFQGIRARNDPKPPHAEHNSATVFASVTSLDK